ncbi:iron(III) transport system ATP-binding protein [Rhodopseudomonas julia]|uniref:Iron(III) transport system ATP-binding protein n=1 Tax=Rhodopseudomonas julia TaxID=200617 RepID=A0ABU0C4X6_9BRAD|nr:ABC transporter ATP-binding protein [Rhodopseudomonas julia]MDQ0325223.1 iron(III) transport system ATP-binding protein [Rhodopseudomonas julia]
MNDEPPILPPILKVDGVTRRFDGMPALDNVSLEVRAGEIVALLGHSGCGKSTLLRIIAGVEDIDRGQVALGRQVVVGGDIFVEPEIRNVGMMFQDYALFPHLTARQNIGFGLKKMPRKEAAARVAAIIERLNLEALCERYPHMMSGGEQQRVALARALAPQPHMLLMDEPFSNLDRGLRERIRRETVDVLRALGTTAIIVTHDAEEALALGDRIVLMDKGRIVEEGSGEDIYRTPRTADAALFFSHVNIVPAQPSGEWLESPIGRFPDLRARTGPVRLFIRPQAMALAEQGIPARVSGRMLLGEIEELVLKIEALEDPLVMRTTARSDVEVGDDVRVRFDTGSILVCEGDHPSSRALSPLFDAGGV